MWKIKYKNKKVERVLKVLVVILAVFLLWGILSLYQRSRYDIKNYNCVHMSQDCGTFFKRLGIPVVMVTGFHQVNNTTVSAHRWLLLWNCIEFEATALIPRKNSDYYNHNIKMLEV